VGIAVFLAQAIEFLVGEGHSNCLRSIGFGVRVRGQRITSIEITPRERLVSLNIRVRRTCSRRLAFNRKNAAAPAKFGT
jgi:hypothetical protein